MQAQDIARYLTEHADFFEQHPELLAGLQLPHPYGGQAISLAERQSMMLRERIKALEARVAEMVRHGQENDAIADRLVLWSRTLLLATDTGDLPAILVTELQSVFNVPFAAARIWSVQPDFSDLDCAQPVSGDTVTLANSMRLPFCGSNVGFEPVSWLADPGAVKSVALLPLRVGAEPATFGLLVLGSPDKDRFQAGMGTAFLERIVELASAALARVRG